MLRLEHVNKDEINLNISTKRSRWTPLFFKAFAIAFALHVLVWLMFHVHRLYYEQVVILPFTELKMDSPPDVEQSLLDWTGVVFSKEEELFLKPILSIPEIPALTTSFLHSENPLTRSADSLQNPFIAIEENWDYLFPKKSDFVEKPKIEMHFSGPLADFGFESNKIEMDFPFNQQSRQKNQYALTYRVQVHGKTGQIIWHVLETECPSEIRTYSEALLHRVKGVFAQQQEEIIVGKIELTLHV